MSIFKSVVQWYNQQEQTPELCMTHDILLEPVLKCEAVKCEGGHAIFKVCLNAKCQNQSLYCFNDACKICQDKHQICSNINLSAFTKILKKQISQSKSFTERMRELQNSLVKSIRQNAREMIESFHRQVLSKKAQEYFNWIYKQGITQKKLKGKDTYEMYIHLTDNLANIKDQVDSQVLAYQKKVEFIQKSLINSVSTISNSISKDQNKVKMSLASKRILQFSKKDKNYYDQLFKNSTLIKEENYKFIAEELKKPKDLQLIFRASQHNFQSKQFHSYCDLVSNTFTVIKTEFDNLIGAYTPIPWSSKTGDKSDGKFETFLLSIDSNTKFELLHNKKAVYHHATYGPCFGSASDLMIINKCDENNCISEFPNHFTRDQNSFQKTQEQLREMFCGSRSGKFEVVEYEVFKVIH